MTEVVQNRVEEYSGPESDALARIQAKAFLEATRVAKTCIEAGWQKDDVLNLVTRHTERLQKEYEEGRKADVLVAFREICLSKSREANEIELAKVLSSRTERDRDILRQQYDLARADAEVAKRNPLTIEQFIVEEGAKGNSAFTKTESRRPESNGKTTAMRKFMYGAVTTWPGELGENTYPEILAPDGKTIEAILIEMGSLPEGGNLDSLLKLKNKNDFGWNVPPGQSYLDTSYGIVAVNRPTKWEGVTADVNLTTRSISMVFEAEQVEKMLKLNA